MHLRYRIAFIGVSIAVLGWAFTHWRDDQLRSQHEIDQLKTQLAQVQRQLQQQQPGLPPIDGDAERRIARVARTEARDQALATLAEHQPGDEAQGPKAPPITFEESRRRVLSAFAAEAVDASWGPDAEHKLERMVRSHLPASSRLNSVACRSSMCELQLTHADAKTHADFVRSGFHEWPGSLFVSEEPKEHGEVAVTIIAAREGTEPPIAPRE
jgi:hypothetical protein